MTAWTWDSGWRAMPSKGTLNTAMRDLLFRALRFFILGAASGGVGAFTVLHADDATTPPKSPPPATSAEPPAGPAADGEAKSDKPAAVPKVFTPTQEISPDQEIDFPADL